MSGIDRRGLLRGVVGGALLSGCALMPKREPPVIDHVTYPMGPMPPRRFGPSAGLCVGAAAVDITPPENSAVWLAGFGFQRRRAKVHDRIYARCLFLDDGARRVALVMADVVGLLWPTVQRVRKLVGPGVQVAVASTHNHQSPDTMGYWGPAVLYALPHKTGIDLSYQRVLERRLAVAVHRAAERARPAKLSFASAQVDAKWVRNLRTPGLFDAALQVMEARGNNGEAIAVLVNFGCHPETLGDRARLLSADFPGRLCARLEEERGGTAIFANGILGGMITPAVQAQASVPERLAFIEGMAEALTTRSVQALEGAQPQRVAKVQYRREAVELPNSNPLFEHIEEVGLIEPRPRGPAGGFQTEVGVIELGPATWAMVPGEPSPQVGLRIKAMLKARGVVRPSVIALGNDELGYILDPKEYEDPNFAYERSVSAGPQTAPLIESALDRLTATAPEAVQ